MTHYLKRQFLLLQAIRDFFNHQDFIDVLTPPMVENPGMEPHIHPFLVTSAYPEQKSAAYLHTSPEFHMKELLSYGFEKIFTLNYCFRDEPHSRLHRPQFIMLEWYRLNSHYSAIEKDVIALIQFCAEELQRRQIPILDEMKNLKPQIMTIHECFKKFVGLDLATVKSAEELKKWIETHRPQVPMPKEILSWDDYFFLLFLNEIEPQLKFIPCCVLKEYPASMAALSTLKKDQPEVCERFEIYLNGVEIANCYNELTQLELQRKRFLDQALLKESLYHYKLPEPSQFYQTMQRGFPASAGIALGVERLLMALTGETNVFWPTLEDN